MSFGIYLVGYIILIAGLATGANLLNVPMQWIGVGKQISTARGLMILLPATQTMVNAETAGSGFFRSIPFKQRAR